MEPYRKGIFYPIHPEKITNKKPIVYRSHLEFRYMSMFDRNDSIKSWGSEVTQIPYTNPYKSRKLGRNVKGRYFVDFTVETDKGTFLIEIKPDKYIDRDGTRPPKKSKNKKQTTYLYEYKEWLQNTKGKWPAAYKYCQDRGWNFLILSEKHINSFNG